MKVGEYIRSEKIGICKIDHINEEATINKYAVNPDCDGWCKIVKTTEVMKHSECIIDLIEAGDYVNGYKILRIDETPNNKKAFVLFISEGKEYSIIWNDTDIETILTKEQYQLNCFKVQNYKR